MPEQVYKIVVDLSDFILRYAVTLAAVGALAMALIEAYKSIFKVRDRYHMRVVRNWIATAAIPWELLAQLDISRRDRFHEEVYRQLVLLTTGQRLEGLELVRRPGWRPWATSNDLAMYSLELERMMSQVQDAADSALNTPGSYPDLFLFLVGDASSTDITNWFTWAREPSPVATEDRGRAKQQADTYARLRQLVRRRLDTLQLTAGYRWRALNQFWAVGVGAALVFGSLVYVGAGSQATLDLRRPVTWVVVAIASLVGGMVAPVAKDLVVALKRVRSG